MARVSDAMAERLIRITRKYGLDYGASYDALYNFIQSCTSNQQDELTKAMLRK